jgi:hypothetical protein
VFAAQRMTGGRLRRAKSNLDARSEVVAKKNEQKKKRKSPVDTIRGSYRRLSHPAPSVAC